MIPSFAPMRVVARKEMRAYFGSPLALIFVGVFLVVTFFLFFWVDAFFARNIADVRPLFRWMPVAMIFLVATLTMRQWSEEQRVGTMEVLLTLPIPRLQLVLGKMLAVIALVAIGLALTLFLPITVSILGDLDWGPVLGGYLATLLMASAYTSIGLFVSSRTPNQIVSLIITVIICTVLYMAGTQEIAAFTGERLETVLRAVGIGSRFESIERGVIDLRDLVYYFSMTAVFVLLNLVSIDMKRWSAGPNTAYYRRNVLIAGTLIVANLALLNAWLYPLSGLRLDLTSQGQYSLSAPTRDLIDTLDEPLLLRGYISDRTHPALAPLVPAIEDMMREYEIASDGRITAEVVDPRDAEGLEQEANQVYGIRPQPFRVAERYQTSVVNSYFDILVRYGDQFETLNFQELIEVEPRRGRPPDVRLRNLEFDLTRAIKRVVTGFQNLDLAYASLEEPLRLTAFVTPGALPEPLQGVEERITAIGTDFQEAANGKVLFELVDPDAPGSTVNRQQVQEQYGLAAYPVSFLSQDSYYLHMVLQSGDETSVIYPEGEMREDEIRASVEAAIRRAVPGFLRTVGVWAPPPEPPQSGAPPQSISTWTLAVQQLAKDYDLTPADLSQGRVSTDIDVLVVLAPQKMTDVERFAIDQFLMGGGSAVIAAGSYQLSPLLLAGVLAVDELEGGLDEMLASYGVTVGKDLVLDPQNQPFPVRTQRRIGGITVSEMQNMDYPFFVDIRRDGMAEQSAITADLPAVTMQWATELAIDREKTVNSEVTPLLWSSDGSWVSGSQSVQPDPTVFPEYGFPVDGEQRPRTLAVSIRGPFESHFKGQSSPLHGEGQAGQSGTGRVIESSPESSRLIVISSSEFMSDSVLEISRAVSADRTALNLQFLQKAVDWSAEDEELLGLRFQGSQTRLLKPLDEQEQTLWEIANYGVALFALLIIGGVWAIHLRSETPITLTENAVPYSPSGRGAADSISPSGDGDLT